MTRGKRRAVPDEGQHARMIYARFGVGWAVVSVVVAVVWGFGWLVVPCVAAALVMALLAWWTGRPEPDECVGPKVSPPWRPCEREADE